MSLLGPSLEQLCKADGLSLPTVRRLGTQIIRRIETLHSHGYLHRDIKPENFLLSCTDGLSNPKSTCASIDSHDSQVFLIDFGLSKPYLVDGKHVPYRENKGLVGTARYVSVNTHLGIE